MMTLDEANEIMAEWRGRMLPDRIHLQVATTDGEEFELQTLADGQICAQLSTVREARESMESSLEYVRRVRATAPTP